MELPKQFDNISTRVIDDLKTTLTHGSKVYVKVHGGGWYDKDDEKKTITLYGSSGDFGEPRLAFLNRIPRELEGYTFIFSPGWNLPGNELDLSDVEWV